MNYRHAFHAGNFADVFKHVLLARILVYQLQKATPLRYIDTHAGLGCYDLGGSEASRSGEWRTGIGRLTADAPPADIAALLAPYLATVGAFAEGGRPLRYPGSPAIAQALLRPADRLLLCELHPEDAAVLRGAMMSDRRAKVLAADGYRALRAALPPPERRGLVLIDPPFEQPDEFERIVAALADACRRWPTGTYALWYPMKEDARVAAFLRDLRALRLPKFLEAELSGGAGPGLRGTGLFVVNPPCTLKAEAGRLLPYLAERFAGAGPSWGWRLDEVST